MFPGVEKRCIGNELVKRSIVFHDDCKTSYPVMIRSSFVGIVKWEELHKQLLPQIISKSLWEIIVAFYGEMSFIKP